MTPPVVLPCGCVVGVGGERCPEAERLHAAVQAAYPSPSKPQEDWVMAWARYWAACDEWWLHVTAEEEEGNA